MQFEQLLYYSCYVIAILICRGLGPIFFVPMIADLGFDLLLSYNALSGWDIRILIMAYGMLWFLWVMVISKTLNRGLIVLLLLVDFTSIFRGVLPQLTAVGAGQMFWNSTATRILEVWMLSAAILVAAVIFRSTVAARFHGEFVDVLTNPRKRFLIPIGLHSAWIVASTYIRDFLPAVIYNHRYQIAAWILVGGWIALELPYYISYWRTKKRYAQS